MNIKLIIFIFNKIFIKDKQTKYLNFTIFISLTLGCSLIILINSIMNGFQYEMSINAEELIYGNLKITSPIKSDLKEKLREIKNINYINSIYETQGLITNSLSNLTSVNVIAIKESDLKRDKNMKKLLGLREDEGLESEEILIPSFLSYEANIYPLSVINLNLVESINFKNINREERESKFLVKKVYKSNLSAFESNYAFINLEYLLEKKLINENDISHLIKLKDIKKRNSTLREIKNLKSDIKIENPLERDFALALKIEKRVLFLVLLLVFFIIGLNNFYNIKRILINKSYLIAVTKILGESSLNLKAIFLIQSLILSLISSVLGVILGIIISKNVNNLLNLIENLINNVIFSLNFSLNLDIQFIKIIIVKENISTLTLGTDIFYTILFANLTIVYFTYIGIKNIFYKKEIVILRA